jgi:cell division protein FtsW
MSTATFRPFPTRTGGRVARPRPGVVAAQPRARAGASTRSGRSRSATVVLKQAAPVCYHSVWIAALLLLVFGICMLLSISMAAGVRTQAGSQAQGVYYYVSRQGVVAVLGVLLMLVVSRLDYRKLRKLSLLFIGLVAVSLLAVHIPGVGHKVNGASSYIPLGPLSYQPSEFAKLAVVLAGAHLLSTPRVKDGGWRSFVLPFGAIGLVLCGLVVWENDFGTALIITGLVVGMLWLAGMRAKDWAILTGGGVLAGGGVMLLVAKGKMVARFQAMVNPWADPDKTGYQLRQSLLALGRGGWFGVGPGRSVQKFNYLPEAHNDMIFAILGEEFGFMGASVIIALFVTVAVACWRLARRCSDPMGKYLIAGCGMIITLQAAINIGGVTGAIPLTGVPLPFVSYGCNSLIVMLVAVGLVLAVARRASAVALPSPAKGSENVTRADSRRRDGRARSARVGAR